MMKKTLLSIICLSTISIANAQLKVHSNGYVSIQSNYSSVSSPFTLGGNGTANYQLSYYGDKNGARFYTMNSDSSFQTYGGYFYTFANNGQNCTALRGYALRNATNDVSSIGVMGSGSAAGETQGGKTYGIYGHLGSGDYGAAVYGQIRGISNSYPDGRYAGYFSGATKVSGNLTVTGSIQGTMLGYAMPTAISENRCNSFTPVSVTDRLSCLNTVAFHHEQAMNENDGKRTIVGNNDEDMPKELKELGIEEAPCATEEDVIEKQIKTKLHYALSVEQLEDEFPELVYEQKDGTKSINYMEMIPLLVQSINELQSQINVLMGKEVLKKDQFATSAKISMQASQAQLFQNTPNPFKERTEIRFALPDNTTNAIICIFDMSGKMLKQIPVNSSMQSITIKGYELAAGMYLYSLVIGGQEIDTKRMILSK